MFFFVTLLPKIKDPMRKGWSHYTRQLLALALNVINDQKDERIYFSLFQAVKAWGKG